MDLLFFGVEELVETFGVAVLFTVFVSLFVGGLKLVLLVLLGVGSGIAYFL